MRVCECFPRRGDLQASQEVPTGSDSSPPGQLPAVRASDDLGCRCLDSGVSTPSELGSTCPPLPVPPFRSPYDSMCSSGSLMHLSSFSSITRSSHWSISFRGSLLEPVSMPYPIQAHCISLAEGLGFPDAGCCPWQPSPSSMATRSLCLAAGPHGVLGYRLTWDGNRQCHPPPNHCITRGAAVRRALCWGSHPSWVTWSSSRLRACVGVGHFGDRSTWPGHLCSG